MAEPNTHEVEIIAPSMEALKEVLDFSGDLKEGVETSIAGGSRLQVSEISKSSGFDATTVILTGMISVAVSTSSAILIEYLKSKLFKKDSKASSKGITILIDGKKIEISGGS